MVADINVACKHKGCSMRWMRERSGQDSHVASGDMHYGIQHDYFICPFVLNLRYQVSYQEHEDRFGHVNVAPPGDQDHLRDCCTATCGPQNSCTNRTACCNLAGDASLYVIVACKV